MSNFTAEQIQRIQRALETSEYEFTCLIARLSQPFRRNAEACRDLCSEALKDLKEGSK